MRRAKIVCTLGPASSSAETIGRLIDAGMNVARLNFSHGTHQDHARMISAVREMADRRGAPIAIMQYLCGPKIRVGRLPDEGLEVRRGDLVALCGAEDDTGQNTTAWLLSGASETLPVIPIDLPDLREALEPGARVYINDGLVRLEAKEVRDGAVVCEVEAGGRITTRKGVNLPGSASKVNAITARDLEDLKMGLAHGVDFVALSFVRQADDIHRLRKHMVDFGRAVPIVAKIEKAEAVENMAPIVEAADAVMVARGDLGIEVPIEETPLIQKALIGACNAAGKPVITATQMLDSMVESPIPTRAEVSDVANAIVDGTDAVMLSQETAIGADPTHVVAMMARIAEQAEKLLDYGAIMRSRASFGASDADLDVRDAVGHAACQMASDLGARGIITCTMSGSTARLIARYRPAEPVYAVTPDQDTWRQLTLTWGVRPLRLETIGESEALAAACVDAVRAADPFDGPARFVLTAGMPIMKRGITNLIRIISVG